MIIQNHSSISVSLPLLRKKTLKILKFTQIPKIDLDLTLVGDAEIRKLNCRFRKKDKATDVLSFPLYEKKEARKGRSFLGDIVISLATTKKQAKEHHVSFHQELLFLIIHGTLHLLGYDHEKSRREARIMRKMEQHLLKNL